MTRLLFEAPPVQAGSLGLITLLSDNAALPVHQDAPVEGNLPLPSDDEYRAFIALVAEAIRRTLSARATETTESSPEAA